MKKFFALFFAFVFFATTLATPVLAATSDSHEIVIVDYVSDANTMVRGASKPKNSIDLSSTIYQIEGELQVGVYTNYKFKPDANGQLQFQFTVDYNTEGGMFFSQRAMTIELYRDGLFDTLIYEKTILMEPHYLDPTQYNAAITYGYIIDGLNPNKEYYFRISKTGDGLYALLSGYVKHPG